MTGKIRTMNGHNDNPTATQLSSAYRKLLHQVDVFISEFSNATPQSSSDVLTVSSFNKGSSLTNSPISTESGQDEEEWLETTELLAIEDCSYLTDKHDTGISYVAHMLEKRLLTGTIYCDLCKDVLLNNEKLCDSMCVNFHQPTKSAYQLCKFTDIALKTYINTGPNFKQKVYLMVLNQIDFDQVFPEFYDPIHDINHKHFIMKFFIDEYINKKCAYISKQNTIALHKRYMRNKLRKISHYMGQ